MKVKIAPLFRFAPVQVTVLALVLYAAVFISVLVLDELPSLPKDYEGLDLDQAFEALSKVSSTYSPCFAQEDPFRLSGRSPFVLAHTSLMRTMTSAHTSSLASNLSRSATTMSTSPTTSRQMSHTSLLGSWLSTSRAQTSS